MAGSGSDLVWYYPFAAHRSSFSACCRRHSGVLTSWVTLRAIPPSVTQMPMLRLPFLAASRCAPFLRSRHNQAGRPCVGQPGGWPRRSGGGLATAARTLCAARQRRRGASLRVAASPLPRARRAQRARQTCLTLVSVPPRGLQPVNDSCRLYSLLAYIVACIYTPRLISANTPPLSTGSADAAPTAAPPQRRSYKPRRPVPNEVSPETQRPHGPRRARVQCGQSDEQ